MIHGIDICMGCFDAYFKGLCFVFYVWFIDPCSVFLRLLDCKYLSPCLVTVIPTIRLGMFTLNFKGLFSVFVLVLQDYGEIEPSFFKEFRGELGHTWVLFDPNGPRVAVECNLDPDFPLLTDGWMRIREVYGLTSHHTIFFKYVGTNNISGRSIFVVDVSPKETLRTIFPSWHTKSKALRRAVKFQKTLTQDDITTELVEY